MSDNTKIEWADATVNAINGCSVTSFGCTNCYAMRLAGTRMKHHPSRIGLTMDTKAGPVWTGDVRLNETALLQPLRWKRPRRIFWNAHGDTFHDAVPDEWIDRVFAVCALTPQHTHMILTKRSARMRSFIVDRARMDWLNVELEQIAESAGISSNCVCRCGRDDGDIPWPLPNIMLGASVEDQARADERIPDLLATPAAMRFLSCEPLLGPIDLTMLDATVGEANAAEPSGLILLDALTGIHRDAEDSIEGVFGAPDPHIDWVIVGGESGPGARPMHPDWARSLRDQCASAGVPFHFKQWGEFAPIDKGLVGHSAEPRTVDFPMARFGKARAGRLLDGIEHNGFPEVRHD